MSYRQEPVVLTASPKSASISENVKARLIQSSVQINSSLIHVKVAPNGDFEGIDDLYNWASWQDQDIPPVVLSRLESPDKVVVRPATLDITFGEFMKQIHEPKGNASWYIEYLDLHSYLPDLFKHGYSLTKDLLGDHWLQQGNEYIWVGDGNTVCTDD